MIPFLRYRPSCQRWKDALSAKGRIPFKSYPDDPWRAAARGDLNAVRDFIEDGFQPNTPNEVGYTIIMSAARGSQLEMIQFLLSRGAKAIIADKRGSTPLHCAVAQTAYKPARQVECVKLLIATGADVNARDESGGTPLMNAAWFGCNDAVKELLSHGATASLADNKGRKASDLAATRGHQDLAAMLS